MYLITIIVCLASLFAASCSSHNEHQNAAAANVQTETAKPATPDQRKESIQLTPGQISRHVYEIVLSNFVPINGKILIGSKTISSDIKFDELKSIPAELRNNFRERNGSPTDIVGSFDVYAKIEIVKVTGEVKGFLTEAKKNFPDAVGLVLVSKVGMTETPVERLVYVEFHKYDATHQSFLLVSRYDPAENRFNNEWIELTR